MAVRSFHVSLRNITNVQFRINKESLKLLHGMWSKDGGFVPPEVIEPMSRVEWASESSGAGTGTEGQVEYLSSSGSLAIHWNNPFVGSNDLNVVPPKGHTFVSTDISGDDARVEITLTPIV